MVSANYGYYNPYNPYNQYGMYNNYDGTLANQTSIATPVFNAGVSMDAYYDPSKVNVQEQEGKQTKDGKDDGKIGFWGGLKNFVKGAVKFVTSPFTDENGKFSLGKTLKSVAIGALFVAGNVLTGGALTPILLATGAAAGAFGMAKAGIRIASATTDAEAEAAWQSMGSSTATVAASVIGAKSYAKGSAAANGGDPTRYEGVRGSFRAVGKTFSDSASNIKAGWDATKTGFGNLTSMTPAEISHAAKVRYRAGRMYANKQWNNVKTTVSNGYQSVKNGNFTGNVKTGIVDAYNNSLPAGAAQASSLSEMSIANITKTVIGIAKQKVGLGTATQTPAGTPANNAGFWANARTQAGNAWQVVKDNPAAVGTYAILARQDIKPDFYDMLTPQEQAYFDQLTTDEKEAIIDQYYSAL